MVDPFAVAFVAGAAAGKSEEGELLAAARFADAC